MNCSRQSCKSTVAALLELHTAIYHAPSLILMLSPSQRKSTELFRKFHDLCLALPGRPVVLARARATALVEGPGMPAAAGGGTAAGGPTAAGPVVGAVGSR